MHIHRFSFSHEKPQVRYWNDDLLSQSPGYGCPHWYLYRHRITCKDTVERWTLMNGTVTIYETPSQELRKVQCLQILAKGLILYYYWFSSRNISTLLLGGSLTIQILRGALDEDSKIVRWSVLCTTLSTSNHIFWCRFFLTHHAGDVVWKQDQ